VGKGKDYYADELHNNCVVPNNAGVSFALLESALNWMVVFYSNAWICHRLQLFLLSKVMNCDCTCESDLQASNSPFEARGFVSGPHLQRRLGSEMCALLYQFGSAVLHPCG
jgi:hypothetical protein